MTVTLPSAFAAGFCFAAALGAAAAFGAAAFLAGVFLAVSVIGFVLFTGLALTVANDLAHFFARPGT